jgi:hypothetical protein
MPRICWQTIFIRGNHRGNGKLLKQLGLLSGQADIRRVTGASSVNLRSPKARDFTPTLLGLVREQPFRIHLPPAESLVRTSIFEAASQRQSERARVLRSALRQRGESISRPGWQHSLLILPPPVAAAHRRCLVPSFLSVLSRLRGRRRQAFPIDGDPGPQERP